MNDSEPTASSGTIEPSESGWDIRLWAVLVVVCGALFLDGLDSAMIGVAVPSIQSEFATSASAVQWTVSAYVLSFGGLLLFAGRLADAIGRRVVLLVGVAILLAGSLLGTFATTVELIIVARFGMGVGAALTAPAGLAIITTTFPEGPARNRAVGIYTACGAVGFSAGLLGGGLLSSVGGRWGFALSVVMAAVVWAGAVTFVPPDRPIRTERRTLNLPGSLALTATMLLLVYTVVEAPQAGWTSTSTLALATGVLVLAAGFAYTERRSVAPLFPRHLFRGGDLLSAALFSAAIMGTYTSFQFLSALYLQQNLHWSPLQMALGFLPLSVLVAIIGPKVGVLISAVGTRLVIATGFGIYAVAYLLFLRIGGGGSFWDLVLPTVVLVGFAFPMSFTGAYVQATSGVPDRDQGVAAAVAQTGYQLGSALVLAVVTLRLPQGTSVGVVATPADYRDGMIVVCAVAFAAFACAVLRVVRPHRRAHAVRGSEDVSAAKGMPR
ncbi:transporter [Rhodococcus sp. p52]|uniref:MFS transporter n=1 Tax=Rhodococcus sp. p52 TaxID=935199 RepID=UPI0008245BB9|nr:MFS transporter [Rhodococcus sp. p52]AOD22741.1 transporter [Rhodococcus sp. p52]